MSGAGENKHIPLIIAVIGAVATIVTACITGFFGVLPIVLSRLNPTPAAQPAALNQPAQVGQASPTSLVIQAARATATLAPAILPTQTPRPSATPEPAALLFASQISANGRAVDPGTQFPASITNLYAVFPAGMAPPGTRISVEDAQAGSYYAFLRVEPGGTLSRLGWRWIYRGKTVNEYEMEVKAGNDIWLGYAGGEGGIFTIAPFGPGKYTIQITLGGNTYLSGELTIAAR
jgi:hypothetical protein